MIADEDMVITVSRGGYIKRSPLSLYRAQRRGGKGRIGMQTKEEDIVEHLFVASAHSYVLVFTDRGRLYWIKVHQIPEVASNARGKAIVNLLTVEQGESVRALLTVRDFNDAKYVVMVTRAGKIKKTELTAFSNVRATGIIAIDINEGDDLYAVRLSQGDDEIFIGTHDGMAIRFNEERRPPDGPRRRRRQRHLAPRRRFCRRDGCAARVGRARIPSRLPKAKSRRSSRPSRSRMTARRSSPPTSAARC